MPCPLPSLSQAYVAYVSIRQHTPAYVSILHHTSAYVSIRQHTSAVHACIPHTHHRVHHLQCPRPRRPHNNLYLEAPDSQAPISTPLAPISKRLVPISKLLARSSTGVSICTFVITSKASKLSTLWSRFQPRQSRQGTRRMRHRARACQLLCSKLGIGHTQDVLFRP